MPALWDGFVDGAFSSIGCSGSLLPLLCGKNADTALDVCSVRVLDPPRVELHRPPYASKAPRMTRNDGALHPGPTPFIGECDSIMIARASGCLVTITQRICSARSIPAMASIWEKISFSCIWLRILMTQGHRRPGLLSTRPPAVELVSEAMMLARMFKLRLTLEVVLGRTR